MTTPDKPDGEPDLPDEALGRPNSASSSQQTQQGQRTQTGSPQLDRANSVDSAKKEEALKRKK
jgi:hypothetical protein